MINQLKQNITIDAAGRPVGRIASVAAHCLAGKDRPDYVRHLPATVRVTIINASKIKLSDKKRLATTFVRYSGHPGGLKTATAGEIITKKGHGALLRQAIRGMLPNNKLRPIILKHLTITA